MPPKVSPGLGSVKQKFRYLVPGGRCAVVAASGVILLLLGVFFLDYRYSQDSCQPGLPISLGWRALWPVSGGANVGRTPTNLSHIVFGIVGSLKTMKARKPYVESWWRPNVTRGYLFLERATNDESIICPLTCPPLRINEDITHWEIYPTITHPVQIRMVRSILETFRQGDRDVRWYVMADDDSVLFVDNIVQVLSGYDDTKYFYLGGYSESIGDNAGISFDMGYGGAGLIFSYPLAAAMARTLDGCIKRYPSTWSADVLTYMCISELGVAVSHHKGSHQIDLQDSLSGFLSSHPQSPLISLHHIEAVDPIFPSMNRPEAIVHLMESADVDQSRLVQQTICYHKENNWSISVSWGYSVHIYENVLPRYILRRPIETFKPWHRDAKFPKYMFNTRDVSGDPCEAPHWFFFESVESRNGDHIVTTTYSRRDNRGLPPCSLGGNHSADSINRIQVLSPAKPRLEVGRAECCDVISIAEKNSTTVRIRPCMEAEEIV